MSRSRQAYRLAYLLAEQIGRHVEVHYLGGGRDRANSGWHVSWGDGPTKERMRQLVAETAAREHGLAALVDADLRYDRGQTDLGEAVALLRHLDAHPDQAPHATTWTTHEAFAAVDFPERSETVWLARGRALLGAAPDNRGTVTLDVVRQLADHAARGGWPAVLAWLDNIATAAADPTVTNLADARRARDTGERSGGRP